MYIGNIHWKHCRLETYIGYWKHNLYIGNKGIRLETLSVYWYIILVWKRILETYIGNIHWKHCRLETYIRYEKHNLDVENITLVWKH